MDEQEPHKGRKSEFPVTADQQDWRHRYRWLGLLMSAAVAMFAPVPPPKPNRPKFECVELVEDDKWHTTPIKELQEKASD